jgi:hypothetical protein
MTLPDYEGRVLVAERNDFVVSLSCNRHVVAGAACSWDSVIKVARRAVSPKHVAFAVTRGLHLSPRNHDPQTGCPHARAGDPISGRVDVTIAALSPRTWG